jgi:hypothetical protein
MLLLILQNIQSGKRGSETESETRENKTRREGDGSGKERDNGEEKEGDKGPKSRRNLKKL